MCLATYIAIDELEKIFDEEMPANENAVIRDHTLKYLWELRDDDVNVKIIY